MEIENKIRITCDAKNYVSLDELEQLQGKLKTLSDPSYAKLRHSILVHGFCAPIFYWQSGGEKFILDGHQRHLALRRMKEEGMEIPRLPAVPVQATSLKDAKEKVLAFVSQYGKVDGQGLFDFLEGSGIDGKAIDVSFDLPDFDFGDFTKEFLTERTKVEFEAGPGGDGAEGPEKEKAHETQYLVIVACADEHAQKKLFEELVGRGYQCKVTG